MVVLVKGMFVDYNIQWSVPVVCICQAGLATGDLSIQDYLLLISRLVNSNYQYTGHSHRLTESRLGPSSYVPNKWILQEDASLFKVTTLSVTASAIFRHSYIPPYILPSVTHNWLSCSTTKHNCYQVLWKSWNVRQLEGGGFHEMPPSERQMY